MNDELNAVDFDEWKEHHWVRYASRTIWGKNGTVGALLVLETNLNGMSRVVFGGQQVYKGFSLEAIDCFNETVRVRANA